MLTFREFRIDTLSSLWQGRMYHLHQEGIHAVGSGTSRSSSAAANAVGLVFQQLIPRHCRLPRAAGPCCTDRRPFEIVDLPLIRGSEHGKLVVTSICMAILAEIDAAVRVAREAAAPILSWSMRYEH